jgi:hypothetical protein
MALQMAVMLETAVQGAFIPAVLNLDFRTAFCQFILDK